MGGFLTARVAQRLYWVVESRLAWMLLIRIRKLGDRGVSYLVKILHTWAATSGDCWAPWGVGQWRRLHERQENQTGATVSIRPGAILNPSHRLTDVSGESSRRDEAPGLLCWNWCAGCFNAPSCPIHKKAVMNLIVLIVVVLSPASVVGIPRRYNYCGQGLREVISGGPV